MKPATHHLGKVKVHEPFRPLNRSFCLGWLITDMDERGMPMDVWKAHGIDLNDDGGKDLYSENLFTDVHDRGSKWRAREVTTYGLMQWRTRLKEMSQIQSTKDWLQQRSRNSRPIYMVVTVVWAKGFTGDDGNPGDKPSDTASLLLVGCAKVVFDKKGECRISQERIDIDCYGVTKTGNRGSKCAIL